MSFYALTDLGIYELDAHDAEQAAWQGLDLAKHLNTDLLDIFNYGVQRQVLPQQLEEDCISSI